MWVLSTLTASNRLAELSVMESKQKLSTGWFTSHLHSIAGECSSSPSSCKRWRRSLGLYLAIK